MQNEIPRTSLSSNTECKNFTTDSLGSGDQGVACSPGTASHYGTGGWPPCDSCPLNTYAASAGTAVCLACRNMTFTTTTGSTACTVCPSLPAAVQAMLQLRNVPACEACGLCCSSKVIYFWSESYSSSHSQYPCTALPVIWFQSALVSQSFFMMSPYMSCTCQ